MILTYNLLWSRMSLEGGSLEIYGDRTRSR
jgi:hypothetical protein